MAAWLPVSASILAVSGLAATFTPGSDCSHCQAPASQAPAITTSVEATELGDFESMDAHDVYVLKFHADWCPKCRSLDPVYSAASREFKRKPVGFVKVDVTNQTKAQQSAEKLKEMGLEDVWEANKGRNGFILLVDAETKESVKVLPTGTTKQQAIDAINGALGS